MPIVSADEVTSQVSCLVELKRSQVALGKDEAYHLAGEAPAIFKWSGLWSPYMAA